MLELRDQGRQGFRLFIRGEVTAGQTLDSKGEFSQSFLGEIDLPILKEIFVAAAHQKCELIVISWRADRSRADRLALYDQPRSRRRRGRTGRRDGPWRRGVRRVRLPLRGSFWTTSFLDLASA